MPFNADFVGVRNYGDNGLMNHLETSIKSWVDWSMLRIGAWTNVTTDQVGAFGGNEGTLRKVIDPAYTDGQVWEGFRKDWVWETGVNYVNPDGSGTFDPQPVEVFVSGSEVSGSGFSVNYPLGRVIFDSAKDDSVTANFSYRNVQTYVAHRADWFHELQYRSHRADETQFTQSDDRGDWSIGGNHRVQMPAVVIEALPRATSRPYQMGDISAWVEQEMVVHVLAENKTDRNNLADIFRGQFGKNVWLFDSNSVGLSGDYPLDANGEVVDASKNYTALVDPDTGHRWQMCRFIEADLTIAEELNPNLYYAAVRLTCELIFTDNRDVNS